MPTSRPRSVPAPPRTSSRRPSGCRSSSRRWRRRWRRPRRHEGRAMTGLRVSEDELRRFVVTRLELMEASEFDRARAMAARLRIPLERAVAERGRIPLGFLLKQLAESWGVGFIDLKVSDVRPRALHAVTEEYARSRVLVPFDLTDDRVHVAMWDPRDVRVCDEIAGVTGLSVRPYLAPEFAIRRAHLLYRGDLREMDERRAPQDGRFEADLGGFKVDLRVSTVPTHWGEKVVMRVLSRDGTLLDLEDLGLSATGYSVVLRNILRPYGMVLVTGPTGSGKTTTLYAVLVRVGAERRNVVNISTIEDPVEYTIPRVTQIPVSAATGVEFATGLRALLRQDPDIIMVGEIRDRETADIAVRAALVGRLLISTLHTNDATGAVPRLLDMGVEPFLLASTLALVVAQRLVRRICLSCRESVAPDETVLRAVRARPDFEQTVTVLRAEGVLRAADDPLAGVRFFRGAGCAQCDGSGFRGRLGV